MVRKRMRYLLAKRKAFQATRATTQYWPNRPTSNARSTTSAVQCQPQNKTLDISKDSTRRQNKNKNPFSIHPIVANVKIHIVSPSSAKRNNEWDIGIVYPVSNLKKWGRKISRWRRTKGVRRGWLVRNDWGCKA